MVHRLAFYASLLSAACLAAADAVIDLGYAKYRGNVSYPDTVAFLGLPYAEPPVADRRWRAPVQLDTSRVKRESRGQVVDATAFPEFCIQGSTGFGDAGGAGSEDCLKVNVYAPLNAKKGDNLPVLVYTHGGGFIFGNPANWPFDHWVHQSPNVVIVSVYYRLHSFGFLSHPSFTSSGLGDNNVGFQDQTEAFRWVQKHISTFGGDPKRVTINGESAGGTSVELHLVAPNQEGLFNAAIAQSVGRMAVPTPEQAEPQFTFYAQQAGCAKRTIAATMACLRKADIGTLARAQDASFYGTYTGFRPVLDGKSLKIRPTPAIIQSKMRKVPLIVGYVSNETLAFGDDYLASLKGMFPQLTEKDLAGFEEQYPLSDFDSASTRARVATGESQFRCAAEIMGNSYSKASKAFLYRYNTPNPTGGSTLAEHAAENWMMFKGTNTGFNGTNTFTTMTASETAFAEELIAYWLSFVRTGDPNTYKLARAPQWPTYDQQSSRRVVLTEGTEAKTGSTIETIPALERRRCEFVATKAEAQQV